LKVPPSIAEGLPSPDQPALEDAGSGARVAAWVVGVLIALAALGAYWLSNPDHWNSYNHFVWQADAFLHGRDWIPFPVEGANGQPGNAYFNDVYPLLDADGNQTGRVLLPFPPLPALVLLPFVALWGLATDQESIAIALGALGVLAAWWMLGGLRIRTSVRALTTILFATGTVWWWAAAVGSTWYLAHLVAVNLGLVAVGVALRRDPLAADEDPWAEDDRDLERMPGAGAGEGAGASLLARLRFQAWPLDRSQVLVGFLLGLAVTARLPLIFAAPFFIFVGGGGSRFRRLVSAGAGGILPVAALLLYTYASTGSLMHPGYDYQYQLEANGYGTLGYNPEWAVEDVRYIPQNIGIMLGAMPAILPDIKPNTLGFGETVYLCTAPEATRSLFDISCPWAMPVDIGTSILLSAPGLLLALIAFAKRGFARLSIGTGAAVVIIALFNLAHFSQGWVQWGYRFSLDFIPFLLPMVALGAARADGRPRVVAWVLVIAGALINAWGVIWGQILGW
jgi:hypothetical protein